MERNYVDFEKPVFELEAKIEALRDLGLDADVNLNEEIQKLSEKSHMLTRQIFSSLTSHQILKLARHPDRPYTLDYIERLFDDFDLLEGDRHTAQGLSMVGGVARFNGQPVMVIGHQKGRGTQEKIRYNFGMPRPEGYRKALRLLQMAEKFKLPVFCLIDTPGAYPGIDAEERNQSEAIARNLQVMSMLRTPVICTVLGEGGSGGALAIGVGDRVLMLQYSVYSVISPEGCAAILWKQADKAEQAAEAMGITAERLLALGLIDAIVPEPTGGAHRHVDQMASSLREVWSDTLKVLCAEPIDQLVQKRYQRLMHYGRLPDFE